MTLRELQQQVLQLPTGDRWELVQTLLESLKQESHPVKRGRLSKLRGIAKSSAVEASSQEDYVHYLTQKYQ